MVKLSFTCCLILFFISGFVHAQIETELDSITSDAQATNFIEHHKSVRGQLITFNKEKHHSKLSTDLFDLGVGGKRVYETEMDKTYYKLIDKNQVLHHRVSYILLDGNKKTLQEISKLRSDIIYKYRQGIPFENLAKRYSMDINGRRGGDTGWFAHGEMIPEFEEQAVNNHHSVGDIFTVDVPSRKWYYVVLKTYDKEMIDEIKVLKLVEPISR